MLLGYHVTELYYGGCKHKGLNIAGLNSETPPESNRYLPTKSTKIKDFLNMKILAKFWYKKLTPKNAIIFCLGIERYANMLNKICEQHFSDNIKDQI